MATSSQSTRAAHSARLRIAAALLSGTVFGVGLSVAQMTDPRKVLAFLDVAGAWDASLLFVLGGAVAVTAVGWRWALRRSQPVLADAFQHPPPITARPDVRLLAGAVLFGIGWGIAGYCPGPALASVGQGNAEALWLVPALVAGAGLRRWQVRRSVGRS